MQEHNYPIKNWAKDDRPREKLRSKGSQHLSDSELLAILIRNGTPKRSAVDLAKDLLVIGKNDLGILGKLTLTDYMKVRGIGEVKAIIIKAALELGRRRFSLNTIDKLFVKGSQDIALYIQSELKDFHHEVFGVIFLNRANRVKHYEIISEGGITATVADPRIILKKALAEDAVSIILFHNHPSGSLRPSRADEELTGTIFKAAKLFDIRVLDHIIVSDEGYFSFADEGMI
ncbi:MAG: DNA repair protein RadC [Flavitalea sp.]